MTDKIEMGRAYVYRGDGLPAEVLKVDAPGDWPVASVHPVQGITTHFATGGHCSGFSKLDLIPAPEFAEDPALVAAREWAARRCEAVWPDTAIQYRAGRRDYADAIRAYIAGYHAALAQGKQP